MALMFITLPSGELEITPLPPRTWTEQAGSTPGDPVTSYVLEREITSAVMFHRRRPLFQGVATSVQSVPSVTWQPIVLSEVIDTYGGHSDSSDAARVRAPDTYDGDDWYLGTGYVPFASASGVGAIAGIRMSNGTVYEGAKMPLGAGHAMTPMVVDLVRMNRSSPTYLSLAGYHRNSPSLNTVVVGKAPSLTLRWASTVADPAGTVDVPQAPHTWTAADRVTADSAGAGEVPFNREVRDVLRWLRFPPIFRGDSAGTAQTLPTGVWTSINLTAEQVDNYGGHSPAAPSRYTVQRPGLYFVYGLAAVTDPGTPAGYRASRLLVNGTTAYAGTSCHPAPAAALGTALPAAAHIRLNAGDYVEVQMIHTQGSAISVKTGTGDCSRLLAVWRGL